MGNVMKQSGRPAAARGYALAVGVGMAALTGYVSPVVAQGDASDAAVEAGQVQFEIAAQPLAAALAQFSEQSGIRVSVDRGLIANKGSLGVRGVMMSDEALERLLNGTGLGFRVSGDDSRRLVAISTVAGESSLAPLNVSAGKITSPRELQPVYAGGQVARGGNLGILGNKDFMDTPFNQTSYTDEYIEDTQSKTLTQALETSPSVRRTGGRYSSEDNFTIRGFGVNGVNVSYDGFYGLGTFRRNSLQEIARVEVLKGPSALLNGVPPDGGVGGTINLVPKRATDVPVTDLHLSYYEDSIFEGHIDIGRRFGEANAFGVRVNAVHSDGETPFDNNEEQLTLGSVALDYLGEKLRLFANINIEEQQQDAATFGAFVSGASGVPSAPDGRNNLAAPFTKTETERSYNLLRAEYDINDNWMAEVGYGWQESEELQYVHFAVPIINDAGDYTEPTFYRFREGDYDYQSANARLTGRFMTGPVRHTVSISAYTVDRDVDSDTRNASGPQFGDQVFNIYDPQPSQYTEPDFSTITPSRAQFELIQEGVAISDTLGFMEDRLQLTVGARHQSLKNRNVGTGTTNYDESRLTPAAAVIYRVVDTVALYANYIEGLTEIQTPSNVVNSNDTFDPAQTEQVEVGAKMDMGRLATTLSVFEITQPNGVTDPVTNIFSLDGEQRNRGVELETFGEIMPGLRLVGGVAYIDAKQVKTDGGGANDGNKASGVPELRANFYGEWDTFFLPALTLTAGLIHTDSQFINAANTFSIDDWTRVDLGARYLTAIQGRDVTLRLRLTNALGKDYWENASLALGEPRSVSLSTSINF